MVLAFDGSGNLTDRYLWGPAVDQVLADEKFTAGSASQQLPAPHAGTRSGRWATTRTRSGTWSTTAARCAAHRLQPLRAAGDGSIDAPPSWHFAFGYTGTYTDTVTGFNCTAPAGMTQPASGG